MSTGMKVVVGVSLAMNFAAVVLMTVVISVRSC